MTCRFTKLIWFYLGACQDISIGWSKFADIIKFANQLPKNHRVAFLLVFSAVCWTLWKYRNDLCFAQGKEKTVRQIILLIISLVHYWSRKVKKSVSEATARWLPDDLDVLPLSTWHPDEEAACCSSRRGRNRAANSPL